MFFAPPPHFFGAFFFEDLHFSGRHITRSLSLLRWYEWLTKPGLVASCHWRQCNSNESFKFPCYYNRFSMILPIFTTQVLSSSTTHLRFNTHTHRRVDDWVDPDTTIRNSFCWWENSNNWKHSRALWIKQKLNIKDRLMVVDFLIRRKWEHSGNGQIDQDCLCYFHTEVLCCLLIWYLSMRIWGLPLVLRFSISSRLENESNVKMCQIYPFVRNKHNFH